MTKKKEETEGRIGVPKVGEAYQEMNRTKGMEEKVARREYKKNEKSNEHLEHEKNIDYGKHLPPGENRIMAERPPFKKK